MVERTELDQSKYRYRSKQYGRFSKMVTTEAWVLHKRPDGDVVTATAPAELKKELFSFPDISSDEVLAEPIYGCWEGNMAHALERRPVDICKLRGEDRIVIGNSGIVRITRTGSSVSTARAGDLCMPVGVAVRDQFGLMKRAPGYDAPNTMGVLAKQMKLHQDDLVPIPSGTRHSLKQWAAFSLRYATAWANWEAAYGCFRVLLPEKDLESPFVWGWGGGCTLAELELARNCGCRTAMMSSRSDRLTVIRDAGITPIDRRRFSALSFDEPRYQTDAVYKKQYDDAEKDFLNTVKELTQGIGVSIFIDYIGSPVVRATLKALGSPGVISTAGWKSGMKMSTVRAIECINWHAHVNTHFAKRRQIEDAVRYAEERGWMPKVSGNVYGWDDIPQLASDYNDGKIDTYFPVYQINPE